MAQSPVVPKEKLSAYQRWEIGSFDAPRPETLAAARDRANEADTHARVEGYRVGHAAGLEAGVNEVRAEAAPRIAQLDQLIASLQADLARIDRELSHEIVQLGLAVARKLVGAALSVQPELVQNSVEEALRHVVQAPGAIGVIVHPADAEMVRGYLATSTCAGSWVLREDASIARGGCRVETGAGEIDATLAQRWERVTAALGEPQKWVS